MAPGFQRDGEFLIGYKVKSLKNDAEKVLGVKLIPLRNSRVTWAAKDALVAVAGDDL
jgi:hypothetical protein